MADGQSLLDVAAAVADGKPVDWAAAESLATSDADRSLLAELRFIAAITQVRPESSVAPASPAASAGSTDAGSLTPPPLGSDEWGPLRILNHIGRGTFGDVYRAWDTRLDREVALKVLRRGGVDDGSRATTVVQEGRLLARVRHPNVVTVYGAERVDGQVGVWMEYVHGRTLEEELALHGPLDIDRVITIGIELGNALATVHRAGVIHRDVKAQNVMVDSDGRLVLTDFGAGVELEEAPEGETRELAGTPLCVAPEVLAGQPATPRSDIYSLGVLLYHLFTASYPVRGRSLKDVREAHASGKRVCLREARPDLPDGLVRIIDRALDPNPGRRYDTLEQLSSELRALLPAESRARVTARRVARLVFRDAVLLAALGIGSLAVGDRAKPAEGLLQAATTLKLGSPRGPGVIVTRAAASVRRVTQSLAFIEFPGAAHTILREINDEGAIVGTYDDVSDDARGITRGFLLKDGSFTTIDVPGAIRTIPDGLNNSGVVVGDFRDATKTHAFLLADGVFSIIDVPGATSTRAHAINAQGVITGVYQDASGAHGFLLADGVFTSLDLPGAVSTRAFGINDNGDVVGEYQDTAGATHSFLFSEGRFTTIDVPGASSTQAYGINRDGTIVGSYQVGSESYRGFSFRQGEFITIDIPRSVNTLALSVNAAGVIVGRSLTTESPRVRGFKLTP